MQRLLAESLSHHMICYAHHGAKADADKYLKIALEQVDLWIQVIDELFEGRKSPKFFDQVVQELVQRDKYFSSVNTMDEKSLVGPNFTSEVIKRFPHSQRAAIPKKYLTSLKKRRLSSNAGGGSRKHIGGVKERFGDRIAHRSGERRWKRIQLT